MNEIYYVVDISHLHVQPFQTLWGLNRVTNASTSLQMYCLKPRVIRKSKCVHIVDLSETGGVELEVVFGCHRCLLCSCSAQWLRGGASDYPLREPALEYCAAMLKSWATFVTLHCSSSLSCINEYLAICCSEYMYEQSSRINCSTWLDASQRS